MACFWLFQCLIDSLQWLSQTHKVDSHLWLSLFKVVGLKALCQVSTGQGQKEVSGGWVVWSV